MFVEERMYTLKIGAVPEYLRHYQNDGMNVQLKHLPHLVGYYFTAASILLRRSTKNGAHFMMRVSWRSISGRIFVR